MQRFCFYWLFFLLSYGCTHKGKNEQPKPQATADMMQLVARVQSRPGNKDFVLLEAYGKWTLEEGSNLYFYGTDGRTGTLVTSGEKLGQFVAADLKSGQVEIGDAVYHRTKPGAPAAAPQVPAPATTPPKLPAVIAPAGTTEIEPVPLPSY